MLPLQAALRWVLAEPLVESPATEQLQRIKFLSLKNLAGLLAQPARAGAPGAAAAADRAGAGGAAAAGLVGPQAAGAAEAGGPGVGAPGQLRQQGQQEGQQQGEGEQRDEALRLYCAALEVDGSDVVLWGKLGTLVSGALGLVAGPRHIFLLSCCGVECGLGRSGRQLSAARGCSCHATADGRYVCWHCTVPSRRCGWLAHAQRCRVACSRPEMSRAASSLLMLPLALMLMLMLPLLPRVLQAAEQGWWALAKHAFERGLECDPLVSSLPFYLSSLVMFTQ